MKRPLFVLALLVIGFHAQTTPMALVVLDTSNRNPGKLPSNWQIKVNHGRPDISVCDDPGGACLHLKSVGASFARAISPWHTVRLRPLCLTAYSA